MKIGNTVKRSALCLGFIGTISSSPINKDNKKRCLDVPQLHIGDITKENGVNIITSNKHNLELMSNDEQRSFFDEKYYDVVTKNWDKFLSSMDSKDKEKNIEQFSDVLEECANVKFIDARKQAGENYVWYKVAENISEMDVVVPLTKPMLPGINELNKVYSNDFLKDKIAYISKDEYDKCVKKGISNGCKGNKVWKIFLEILSVSGAVGACALGVSWRERRQMEIDFIADCLVKVYDAISWGIDKLGNLCGSGTTERGIDTINLNNNREEMEETQIEIEQTNRSGSDIIEDEIDMFDLDNNSIISDVRTMGGNNIQEMDIVESDRSSEHTMFN